MTPGERGAIQRIIRSAKAAGFIAFYVYDGEATQWSAKHVRGRTLIPMTEPEVLAACESVDDSHIHFRNEAGAKAWARIVLGNAEDGSELPADNSITPGFAEAMDRVTDPDPHPCGRDQVFTPDTCQHDKD